jgi:2-keto-4-pentenoate hydratase/2-oxohepta-3-ene-1,7-dioic acid hydratase in catechol pathway
MRIARIAGPSGPAYVVQGGDGSWVELGSLGIHVTNTPELVAAADALSALDIESLGGGVDDPSFMAPVVAPGKLMAIGLNYSDHIRETNSKTPPNPILFMKANTSLTGPEDDIVVDPDMTSMADYENELTVIIGRHTKGIAKDKALESVFGYTVANDVSARDCMKADGQLVRSKSFDTYCPIGPWITTADEVPDPQKLAVKTLVNGEVRQDSSTSEMLYPVDHLIYFLARGMTLEPGDVLLTGTPHGVGFAMDPPRFLNPGDVVECEVEGLGTLRNRIVTPGS